MEAQEEKPDIFTVSVGNIPPQAEVLIKITYVTELAVDGADILFTVRRAEGRWDLGRCAFCAVCLLTSSRFQIPAALAPKADASQAPVAQTDVRTVKIDHMTDVQFSLQVRRGCF